MTTSSPLLARTSSVVAFPELIEATKSFKVFPLGWLAKQDFINFGESRIAHFFRESGHGMTDRVHDKLDRVADHLRIVTNNLVKYRDRFPVIQVDFTAQVLNDLISLTNLRIEIMEQSWYRDGISLGDSRRVNAIYEIEKKDSDQVIAKCKRFLSALGFPDERL